MFFVIRSKPSESARALAKALDGRKIKAAPKRPKADSAYISWGERSPIALNGGPLRNKWTDAELLRKANIPTIETSLRPVDKWLPRLNNHIGGNDLINPPQHPDFWVKKENIVAEYRIHTFQGRSIRAGKKVHRNGTEATHPWIRSWSAGWRISYDGNSVKQRHRDIAHGACKALGLEFAAVDVGEREDGTVIVLEVNRAPGIEAGTIEAYARAIKKWREDNA